MASQWQAMVASMDRSCLVDEDCTVAGAIDGCDCAPAVAVGRCGIGVRRDAYESSPAEALAADFLFSCDTPALCDCGSWEAFCTGGVCTEVNTFCCMCPCGDDCEPIPDEPCGNCCRCTCGDGDCVAADDETCVTCPEDCGICTEPGPDANLDGPPDGDPVDAPSAAPDQGVASSGSEGCGCTIGGVPGPPAFALAVLLVAPGGYRLGRRIRKYW